MRPVFRGLKNEKNHLGNTPDAAGSAVTHTLMMRVIPRSLAEATFGSQSTLFEKLLYRGDVLQNYRSMKSAIECQRPSWSIPTTTVPFVIGLIALGCAAGEAPVESSEDAGLRELPSMTPISPANGTNLNGANSNTTPATMADQSGVRPIHLA